MVGAAATATATAQCRRLHFQRFDSSPFPAISFSPHPRRRSQPLMMIRFFMHLTGYLINLLFQILKLWLWLCLEKVLQKGDPHCTSIGLNYRGMCRLISSALLRRGAVHIIPPPHLSLCASVCVCVAVISLSFKRRIWQYTFTPCLEWNSPGSTRCTHDIEGWMNACTWKMLVLQTILSLVNA